MADAFVNELLKNASVTVEVSGLPPFTVSLAPSATPNPVLGALRPRITVVKSGVTLATVEPWGSPRAGAPWGAIAVGGAVLGLGLLFFFAAR